MLKDRHEPENFVSVNQFEVIHLGVCLLVLVERMFVIDSIVYYLSEGIICVECQVLLGASETIMAKILFEDWLWEICCRNPSFAQ
jgi:hypothetical protein